MKSFQNPKRQKHFLKAETRPETDLIPKILFKTNPTPDSKWTKNFRQPKTRLRNRPKPEVKEN